MNTTTTQSPVNPSEAQPTTEAPAAAFDDDWDHEPLPVRPVRRRLGPLTLFLVGLLLATSAFAGGVMAEKTHLGSTATATAARPASSTAAAGGRFGAGTNTGSTGASGGATTGTVKLIDGTNIYITDSNGTTVKVATTPQSQISITAPGSVTAIKPGDNVTVSGATGSDGTITAANVRDSGAGASTSAGANRGTNTPSPGATTNNAAPTG
jgi:hypothetical protein